MANELTRQEHRLLAIAVLFGLQTYLRPGELIQLHKMDLIGAKKVVLDSRSLIVCPQERNHPTKTGACPPGLRLAGLDETAVATSEKWYKGPQTVAFRTQEIRNTVLESSADLLEAVILGPP